MKINSGLCEWPSSVTRRRAENKYQADVARRFDHQSGYWSGLTAIAGYPKAYEDLFAELSVGGLLPRCVHCALDVGTGTGTLASSYRRRATALHHLFGLDLSLRMLHRARASVGERPGSFTAADAAELPFPTALFHLVMSAHCMEHATNPSKVVGEMARVVRNGGLLICVIGRPGILESLTRKIWRYSAIAASDVMRWMWESNVAPLRVMRFGRRSQLGHWLSEAVIGQKPEAA